MTQNQQAQILAYTKIMVLAGHELLNIAQRLKDDVDTAIVIADSVKEIATANSRIIDHIHGITNSLDVEVLKEDIPTLAAYGDTRYSVKEIPQ